MNSFEKFKTNILTNLNKFDDIYKILKNKNYKTKQIGDFFEIITKMLLEHHSNYLKKIKKV